MNNNHDASHTMSLLTTTTGFVDVYVIEADQQLPWLIPQNLVLAALSAESGIQEIEWRDNNLPVLSLVNTKIAKPVALVIESLNGQRFALLAEKMPDSHRVRISSLHDEDEQAATDPFVFQVVKMQDQLYQVPNFEKINQHLATMAS
ncbi:MAG: hypothetical protein EOO69_02020 [Moraxellaceae bacterium]|nr:MAG: hypothetical protein EOO69_02020 [Moraxellaceae bacterium]